MKMSNKLWLLMYWVSFSVICCDLNNEQAIVAEVPSLLNDATSRQVLLSNNATSGLTGLPGVLQMHSADNLQLIDRIDHWPMPAGMIDSIDADPVAVDVDYDGIVDALYAVNRTGLVWFIRIQPSGFAQPELIADLSFEGASFKQPLQLVQYSNDGKAGIQHRQVMLLLIASTANAGDVLMAVKHQRSQSSTVTLNDLTDRTLLTIDEENYGIDEQLWQQIKQGAGWFVHLNARMLNVPKVYAGVVYFSAADTAKVQADCTLTENTLQQFYAVHLHHAGSVYVKRNWLMEAISKADLSLQTNEKDQLQLVMQSEQQQHIVVDAMLAISELCADCVEELSSDQFPKIIRLATFQSESY